MRKTALILAASASFLAAPFAAANGSHGATPAPTEEPAPTPDEQPTPAPEPTPEPAPAPEPAPQPED